jgi:PKD repeat protein
MPRNLESTRRPLLSLLLGLVLMLGMTAHGYAQACSEGSPAYPVPPDLWGSLKPGDRASETSSADRIAADRDATTYTGNNLPWAGLPLFSSVDVENNTVFTSYATGLRIYGAGEKPQMLGSADIRSGRGCSPSGVYDVSPECTEIKHFFWDVDAPPGKDDVVAMAGIPPVGLVIMNTTSKSQPSLLYQDIGRGGDPNGTQVYSATIAGRDYAFLATNVGPVHLPGQFGIYMYDMTAAKSGGRCSENTTTGPLQCPGVFKGRIGDGRMAIYVDGTATASGKNYLTFSSGGIGLDRGVEIWDVSSPGNPRNVHSTQGRFLTDQYTHGVAMWEQSGRQYLATHRGPDGAQIFDVTSCLSSGCTSLGSPVWSTSWSQFGKAPTGYRFFVTFSRSGQTPMLYFGAADQCSGGRQREFLFDVTRASSPDEITPDGTKTMGGKVIDYWGWYYAGNNPATGFSRVTPSVAKFGANVLYRAASTLLDTHVWTQGGGVPPTANFSWSPETVYAGDPVTFTDTSTGGVTTRNWTFQDGTPAVSSAASQSVVFESTGLSTGQLEHKDVQVTLNVSNQNGADPDGAQQTVRVRSPYPSIGGVTRNVQGNVQTCQAVTFQAEGVTGKPAPGVSWVIRQGATQVHPLAGEAPGDSFTLNPFTLAAGSYTAVAKASNSFGQREATNDFNMIAPAAPGFLTGTDYDSFTAGTVKFHSRHQNATEWNWDFGDGQGFRGYTGEYAVSDPVFSYSSTGTKTVRVRIRNCTGTEQERQFTVNISQISPLKIITFIAQGCGIPYCPKQVNAAVTFVQEFEGNPTQYEYDWTGDGTFEQTSSSPVATHTYATTGVVTPVIRIVRGAETVTLGHSPISIESGGGGNEGGKPVITIGGPATGAINTALSFSANATGCTASNAGWTWTAAGGTISGSGSTVSITWTSAGSKQIGATNSGCSGAQGAKSVAITDGNGGGTGGGSLAANFAFTPTAPKSGETVSFDAASSTGTPSSFSWDFGGGVTKSGAQVTHVFAAEGTYTVRLEVGKPGNCPLGLCVASVAKQVTVGAGGPPALVSAFNLSGADCVSEFGVDVCTAEAGKPITFTDASQGGAGVTSWTWSFGDGATATGATVTHTFTRSGLFPVSLTVSDGTRTANSSRNVIVNGGAPATEALVLPWIAKTVDGSLVQSSDLYVHNPGTSAMDVTLEFRRRGLPETTPPKSTKTIAPNGTLFVRDVVKEMFGREDITGFVGVNVDNAGVQPIMTAFNTTFANDGTEFGQTIPGFGISNTGVSSTTGNTQIQHLVGLNDNSDRLAYFGLSNPSNQPVTYRLRFVDNEGRQIGTPSAAVTLSRFGFKQYQAQDIRTQFGITDKDDYRVVVESAKGAPLFPYAANLRRGSKDPSFVTVGTGAARVYLIGAMSTPGINNSLWQSDLVIANTSDQVVISEVTFTGVGVATAPTDTVRVTLQPGETQRLDNLIDEEWGIRNRVGVLTIESDAPNSLFPVIQGESYENTVPSKRYGQTLPAMTESQAAGPNQGQYLVGLRQDAKYRTTFWVFNPGTTNGVYDIIYRSLDGQELGRVTGATLPSGKMRQFSPGQHRLPAGGVQNGFTVQVLVRSGKVLAAAQVVNGTNDPAYIQGERR